MPLRLQQWVKRKITDAPTEADAGPSASIRCPHDGLLPEKAAGAKRLLVPENLWLFLREDALNVKPDDRFGCCNFSKDSVPCSQCQDELSEVASFEDSMRCHVHFGLSVAFTLIVTFACRCKVDFLKLW